MASFRFIFSLFFLFFKFLSVSTLFSYTYFVLCMHKLQLCLWLAVPVPHANEPKRHAVLLLDADACSLQTETGLG